MVQNNLRNSSRQSAIAEAFTELKCVFFVFALQGDHFQAKCAYLYKIAFLLFS